LKIFQDYQLPGVPRRAVIGVGNFDGVHLGHQAVIREVIRMAGEKSRPPGLFTFYPHPLSVIAPGEPPPPIFTLEEKFSLLREAGLEFIISQEFDEEFARLSREAFIGDVLVSTLDVSGLVVGDDFRFGSGGSGDVDLLLEAGERHGFSVTVSGKVVAGGRTVSSSLIRELISRGAVEEAARFLGRPYHLTGKVIAGEGLGGKLGFPTANLIPPDKLIPPDGVYAGEVALGEAVHPAAVNIGVPLNRPDGRRLVESHLLDYHGQLRDLEITVRFMEKLRDEIPMTDPKQLAGQLEIDISRVRESLSRR
jgi:riboflavin kinase/FMN adenylyltransferase